MCGRGAPLVESETFHLRYSLILQTFRHKTRFFHSAV